MKPATMSSSIGGNEFRDRLFAFHKLTAQQVEHDRGNKHVEDREYHEGNGNLTHGRDSFLRPHHAVNDPGLTANFGHDPARFDREEPKRAGRDQRAKEPFAVWKAPMFPREQTDRNR